jgi:hypothetical protein
MNLQMGSYLLIDCAKEDVTHYDDDSLCSSGIKCTCVFVFDRLSRPSYLPCKCAVSFVESLV